MINEIPTTDYSKHFTTLVTLTHLQNTQSYTGGEEYHRGATFSLTHLCFSILPRTLRHTDCGFSWSLYHNILKNVSYTLFSVTPNKSPFITTAINVNCHFSSSYELFLYFDHNYVMMLILTPEDDKNICWLDHFVSIKRVWFASVTASMKTRKWRTFKHSIQILVSWRHNNWN